MSNCSWRICVAIGGAVLALFLSACSCGPEPSTKQPDALWKSGIGPLPECQPDSGAGGADSNKHRAKTPGARAEQRGPESAACQEATEGAKRDKADLEAQWRSAIAGENVAWLTCRQTMWTQLEFFALLATVAAAFLAIFDARRHAEKELRAYVTVSPGTVQNFIAGGRPEILLTIKNVGQTPVHNMVHATGISVFPKNAQNMKFNYPTAKQLRADNPVGAFFHPETIIRKTGLTGKDGERIPLNQEQIDSVISDTDRLYVHGLIIYEDIFGRTRETEFAYMYYGPNVPTFAAEYCRKGNRAA